MTREQIGRALNNAILISMVFIAGAMGVEHILVFSRTSTEMLFLSDKSRTIHPHPALKCGANRILAYSTELPP